MRSGAKVSKGANVCKSCRSRQELSNGNLLAKLGVDTAENGPLKVCQQLTKAFLSPAVRKKVIKNIA